MKITININKKTAEHLSSPHMFTDECSFGCDVLYKVQKEINKFKQKKKANFRKRCQKKS